MRSIQCLGRADPNTAPSTGFSPLYAAANRGVPRISKILLEYNGDPNRRIGNGETPLFAALRKTKARDEMVELLLKAGANVSRREQKKILKIFAVRDTGERLFQSASEPVPGGFGKKL